jgi:hypothetical protein
MNEISQACFRDVTKGARTLSDGIVRTILTGAMLSYSHPPAPSHPQVGMAIAVKPWRGEVASELSRPDSRGRTKAGSFEPH